MTFEGEVKEIPIKGIERAGSDNLCADGAMNEVIGLEYKEGSYVPYVEKKTNNVSLPSNTIKTWCHKTSSVENIIALDASGNVWWSNTNSQWQQITGLSSVTDICFVGNMLCAAAEFVSSYIFSNGTYRIYSEFNPNSVRVSVDLEAGIYNKELGHINNVASVYRAYENNDSVKLGGLYDRARSYLCGKGGIYGTVLVAYGWRTNTGDIKYVSQVRMHRENMPFYNTGYLELDKYAQWWEQQIYTNKVFSYADHTISEGEFKDIYNPKIQEIYYDSSDAKYIERDRTVSSDEIPPFTISEVDYTRHLTEEQHYKNYACVMNGKKLSFTYNGNVDFSKTDIRSLCIFMSAPIDRYEFPVDKTESIDNDHVIKSSTLTYTMSGNHTTKITSYYPKFKSNEEFSEAVGGINALYLVGEIYVDDLVSGSKTYVDLSGKLTSMEDNSAQQTLETLKINDTVDYAYRYPQIDTYNSRLHLFNVLSGITFDGSDFSMLFGSNSYFTPDNTAPSGYGNKVRFVVEIKNTDGTFSYAIREIRGTFNTSGKKGFCQFVSVNIPNATRVIVQYYVGYEVENEFVLKKNNTLGISYYIDSSIKNVVDLIQPTSVSSRTPYTETEKDHKRENMLAVSETYNTTSIDEKNVYTIGDGEIVGLANISMALSQDTFGKYPLLVFCTDGIYSLPVDETGQSAYSAVPAPFSREVCVNRKTICEIDGSVLFASSKGLMIASSEGVSMFTPNLNGAIRFKQKASVLGKNRDGNQIYGDMIGNSSIVQLSDATSSNDFIKYLQLPDTTLSYVSNKNKVIVYNKTMGYVYWIDIPTRNTTKLKLNVWFDNDNFPTETYYNKDSNGVYTSYDFEYLSQDSDNDCMFQMRPIKVADGLKTSFRVELQGFFSSSSSSKWSDLVVLGSLDGEHWYPIGIKEKELSNGFHNLGCITDRVSCKYLMVLFAGNLSCDSHIDRIILSCEGKYNNKLKV